MSREDAAVTYLDVMLGFSSDYVRFQRASAVLAEEEKGSLLDAVLDRQRIGPA